MLGSPYFGKLPFRASNLGFGRKGRGVRLWGIWRGSGLECRALAVFVHGPEDVVFRKFRVPAWFRV